VEASGHGGDGPAIEVGQLLVNQQEAAREVLGADVGGDAIQHQPQQRLARGLFLLGMLALGDVVPAGTCAERVALRIVNRLPGHAEPSFCAVFVKVAELKIVSPATTDGFLEAAREQSAVFIGDDG